MGSNRLIIRLGAVITLGMIALLFYVALMPYLAAYPIVRMIRQEGGSVGTRSIIQPIFIPTTRTIDKVDFRDSGLTDEQLARLAPGLSTLPHLKYLILTNTKVTDNGLRVLEDLPSIEYIYLDGTQVTDDGVRMLRQEFPNARTIAR